MRSGWLLGFTTLVTRSKKDAYVKAELLIT